MSGRLKKSRKYLSGRDVLADTLPYLIKSRDVKTDTLALLVMIHGRYLLGRAVKSIRQCVLV